MSTLGNPSAITSRNYQEVLDQMAAQLTLQERRKAAEKIKEMHNKHKASVTQAQETLNQERLKRAGLDSELTKTKKVVGDLVEEHESNRLRAQELCKEKFDSSRIVGYFIYGVLLFVLFLGLSYLLSVFTTQRIWAHAISAGITLAGSIVLHKSVLRRTVYKYANSSARKLSAKLAVNWDSIEPE